MNDTKDPNRCHLCFRIFPRKWNLRRHSIRKHGYDPITCAVTVNSTNIPFGFQSREDMLASFMSKRGDAKAVELMKAKLQDSLILEGLRTGIQQICNVKTMSGEAASSYLFNNFELIGKKSVQGISGHICNRCKTFDFGFIKIIGIDLTSKETHRCAPEAIARAGIIQDEDSEIRLMEYSTNCLVSLAHSVFGPRIVLTSDSRPNPLYFQPNIDGDSNLRCGEFHAPVFRNNSIQDLAVYTWLKPAIENKGIVLGEVDLWNFICAVSGTYALFAIKKGPFAGVHRLELGKQ